MKRLKITLVGLVLVLTLVVAYGYGCGDSGEDTTGGSDSVAAEADGTGASANGEAGDGTAAADGGEAADGSESTGGEAADGSGATEGDGATDGGGAADGGDGAGGSSADGSGPGDGASASGRPLTKPQFIKQADEICNQVPVKYGESVQKIEAEARQKKEPKPSTAEINLKAAVPPLPEAAKEIEELVPPKGDEAEAEAIVAALEAAAKGLEEKPSSPLSGPQSPFDEFQKLTRKYGMQTCSQL